MKASFEITDRFIDAGDADELLYAPLEQSFTYRKTRRYHFDFEGDRDRVRRFVTKTLVDQISQTMHEGEEPAVEGFLFALDYGMKPGALDLEKEAVVSYYKRLSDPGFELNELVIRQRIYVFPENRGDQCSPELFIRDICNGAIHNWNTIEG